MSRELASSGSNSGSPNDLSLSANLFQASLYKTSHGQMVRRLTVLAIWLIVLMGCYRLYVTLRSSFETTPWMGTAIPVAIATAGCWFGFRLVNWPRFADFLIAVEAEMKKVTWPSKQELIRASVVVIATIIILALTLFFFDAFWQWVFEALGVTG